MDFNLKTKNSYNLIFYFVIMYKARKQNHHNFIIIYLNILEQNHPFNVWIIQVILFQE